MPSSSIAMNDGLNEQQLEQLIEEITRQIFCYLGDRQLCELRGLEIDEVVCPGCDQRCVETCPHQGSSGDGGGRGAVERRAGRHRNSA